MNESRILRISKRLRNIHRRGKMGVSLKEYARLSAAHATSAEQTTNPVMLDRKGTLTTAALAWAWLAERGMAPA
jgi:hypothetical protein